MRTIIGELVIKKQEVIPLNTNTTPYFSVMHGFTVYLSAWPAQAPLPSLTQLQQMLPPGLQLVSEVKALEASNMLQIRHLDDAAKTLVDYLKLQSRKIDLVLQYMLEQEPHGGQKYRGIFFGGSGCTIETTTELEPASQFTLNLYIKEELVALLCLAKVISCTLQESDAQTQTGKYHVVLEFTQILDSDVELLVKASLSVQQKQLKQRNQPT